MRPISLPSNSFPDSRYEFFRLCGLPLLDMMAIASSSFSIGTIAGIPPGTECPA